MPKGDALHSSPASSSPRTTASVLNLEFTIVKKYVFQGQMLPNTIFLNHIKSPKKPKY